MLIYPPKYILGGSSLSFGKYSGKYIFQEAKQRNNADMYTNDTNFVLHFVIRNIHRGEGEISKPTLMITAKNSKQAYLLKPNIDPLSFKKSIHVGPYGIVDEFFQYSIGKWNKDLIEFLENNKKELQFKICGYPYKETYVSIRDIDLDHVILSEEDYKKIKTNE